MSAGTPIKVNGRDLYGPSQGTPEYYDLLSAMMYGTPYTGGSGSGSGNRALDLAMSRLGQSRVSSGRSGAASSAPSAASNDPARYLPALPAPTARYAAPAAPQPMGLLDPSALYLPQGRK